MANTAAWCAESDPTVACGQGEGDNLPENQEEDGDPPEMEVEAKRDRPKKGARVPERRAGQARKGWN